MPAEPPDPSPDHVEPPADAIDRAAALDDFFGGLTASPASDAVGRLADDAPLPGSLDLLLLLRQVGAQGGSPPESPPEKIGRYNVRRLAGRGGFSLVWEAFDPVLRRRVAVKVCTPDALISPSVRRRFRREAELASRLVHPHIVTIHEVGEADGLEFITSEFCAGGSLADWLVRHPRPVPPPVAAKIARALAHAAAHAHESGIIHRDIKPGNVMLVPVDDRDSSACIIPPQRDTSEADATPGMTVKLVDFGLGRQNDPGDGDDPLTQLTTEGARLGTPAWMAPEQIDRSFGPVGPATDVHAIGLLLHRMLTGRPLRGGKTDIETYREVLLDEPPAANWVARGVSPDLGAVCLKCLAKQPEGRYATAAALADDLSRWLAGLPTRARPLSPLQRLGRGIARRPLVAALLTAAVLATALAGWASLERSRELRAAAAHREEILRQNAAAELRRGFESLRSANVAGALDQLAKTRRIDPVLADSLAGRCLARRLHGEREILLRPDPDAVGSRRRIDLYAVAVSDDGRTIAAGGSDGVLRVIRAFDDHSSLTEISAHDEINDVSVSSDGRLVASVGQNGRLRWWAADAGGDLAGEAPPVGCPLYAVAFSADDTEIYFGGEDRTLRRIRLTDGSVPQEVHRFPWSGNAAPEIEVMSRVGTMLVVACGGSLAAFDTADERPLWSWNREAGDPSQAIFHALEISPDGRRVAAGGTDRELRIWDGQTGKLLTTVSGHPNWIQACRFSADGTLLATASRDGVVRVFDATTAALVGKLVGHAGRVWDIDFDPDGSLVSAGGDGTLRRWECRDPILPRPLRDLPLPGHEVVTIRDASFDGRGRLVALRMGACPLLIDVETGALTELEVDEYPTHHGVAVDHKRKRIAYGSSVTRLSCSPCVMRAEAGTWRRQPAAAAMRGIAVGPYICWTPDGRLVSASQTGEVFMWSPMLEIVTKLADVLSDYRSAAAPAGPPRVAIASRPGSIIRLDQEGAIVAPPLLLEDVGDHLATLAWSPDGLKLTCGLRNGSVHVFDAMTGRCIGMLAPHEQQVVDVAYSADGRVVVTADGECLRVSDAATLTTFDEIRPGWRIQSMCLALDGSFAAIAGWASGTAAGQPAREGRLAILDLEP